eukprot:COSAG06_NODE_3433_length_5355_cov_6.170282_3_plen_101_part_00
MKGASADAVLESVKKLYAPDHGGDETVQKIHLKRSLGAKMPAESGIPGVMFQESRFSESGIPGVMFPEATPHASSDDSPLLQPAPCPPRSTCPCWRSSIC